MSRLGQEQRAFVGRATNLQTCLREFINVPGKPGNRDLTGLLAKQTADERYARWKKRKPQEKGLETPPVQPTMVNAKPTNHTAHQQQKEREHVVPILTTKLPKLVMNLSQHCILQQISDTSQFEYMDRDPGNCRRPRILDQRTLRLCFEPTAPRLTRFICLKGHSNLRRLNFQFCIHRINCHLDATTQIAVC